MHCCIKKSAAYGCQPQLPSGSRQAFSFPLLNRSLIKKPLIEGLFFVTSHLAVTLRAVAMRRQKRLLELFYLSFSANICLPGLTVGRKHKNGQSALSKKCHFN